MSTLKQIQANRLNARKSTGPRSVEGKAVSRMNALKSGIDAESQIIDGESTASLEALTAKYYDRFQPATPDECFYVDTLVRDEWQLRRFSRVDAQIWANGFTVRSAHDAAPLGTVFSMKSSTFIRLQRRIDAAERSYQRALRELNRLQSERHALPPAPAPQPDLAADPVPQLVASPVPSPQIGFVPQAPAVPQPALAPHRPTAPAVTNPDADPKISLDTRIYSY